jgi:hypothetical protein
MADYYPLLAKAVANLPSRAAPTARRAIYERARKALIGQLRSIQPPMPEGDIAGEDAALDKAIARLEAEYGAQPAAARAPATAPPATSQRPTPASPPSLAVAPSPSPPIPRPASALSPKPLATPAAALNSPARTPVAPPATTRPTLASRSPVTLPPARPAPLVETAPPLTAGAPASDAPTLEARRVSNADDQSQAPPIAASPPAGLGIPNRAGVEIARPIAPGRTSAPRRNPWPIVALAALACVAGAIALAAYLWREKPQDLAIKTTTETAETANQASQNKIAQRVKAAGQSDAPAAVAETPIPVVTVPVAPVLAGAPAAPAPAVPAPIAPAPAAPLPVAPTHPTDTAQNGAAAPAPPPAAAVNPASAPAAIIIDNSSDPQKPTISVGAAVWSIIPALAGQPSSLGVRVEVDIPDQKMHVSVTIKKNDDATLPATHTIDLRATFAPGAQIKGIKDMTLPQLRKDDARLGDPLSGVRVKIDDSYYLVGLTRSAADAAHNLDLLANRGWFDFPLQLSDDKAAKLTFAKGADGARVMAQALDAWK